MIWFVLLALVLLAAAIAIDYSNLHDDMLLTSEEQLASLNRPFWEKAYFWSALLREAAFAFFIAVVIAVVFEAISREEQVAFFEKNMELMTKQHESYRREIAENVLSALLKSRVPSAISDIALDILIAQRVIRTELYIKYTLSEINHVEYQSFGEKYILVTIRLHYDLVNISQEDAEVDIQIHRPTPSDPRLLDLVRIDELSVEGKSYSREDIDKGNERIANSETEMRSKWPVIVPATGAKRLSVQTTMTIIKERSDSDVWTTLYPTVSGHYEVVVEIPTLEWHPDALHSGKLTPIDRSQPGVRVGGTCNYRLENGLLPFQGVLLWWRPKVIGVESDPGSEDGGLAAPARDI